MREFLTELISKESAGQIVWVRNQVVSCELKVNEIPKEVWAKCC